MKKSKLSFADFKTIGVHLLIVLGVIIVLCIAIMVYLRFYTSHGESVKVPNFEGMRMEQVEPILEELNLQYEIIDSVYNEKNPLGTIVEQVPIEGSYVKENRKIYLILNSVSKPLINIPEVLDLSSRNAKATLESLGFVVTGIEYVPSKYNDLVVGLKTEGGSEVNVAQKLAIGTKLILEVSNNGIPSDSIDSVGVYIENVVDGVTEPQKVEPIKSNHSSSDEFF